VTAGRWITAVLWLGAACSAAPVQDPVYRPTENVLEVLNPLRLHIEDDTYRRPPARDFTGKNIYRASFARLENMETTYASKLRSGYLQDSIWFGMARSAERIGEYEVASKLYAKVAALTSELAEPARAGRDICNKLRDTSTLEPKPDAPPQRALEAFGSRIAKLEKLLEEVKDTHFVFIVREEIERADLARARYFGARRRLERQLDTPALEAYQELVKNHPDSKNRNRNLLELGRVYEELARDYVYGCPAVALCFDPATFDEYTLGASRIYEAVSQQDGAVEKIEAGRRLEALLAFILQVYDDKLPGDLRG